MPIFSDNIKALGTAGQYLGPNELTGSLIINAEVPNGEVTMTSPIYRFSGTGTGIGAFQLDTAASTILLQCEQGSMPGNWGIAGYNLPMTPTSLFNTITGVTIPWTANDARNDAQASALQAVTENIPLVILGNTDGTDTLPPGTGNRRIFTFSPLPALQVEGGLSVLNDGLIFNQIQGITSIPEGSSLVLNRPSGVSALGTYWEDWDTRRAGSIKGNLTLFGTGMNTLSQIYPNGSSLGNGAGLILWGGERTGGTVGSLDQITVTGAKLAMEHLYGDPGGFLYGTSFVIRVVNPYISGTGQDFTDRLSILQYSPKRNQLILGTVEGNQGKTRLISGHQVEITSELQVGQYAEATTNGEILLAGNRIRFAGSSTPGQFSELFFDNIISYATASAFPALNRPDYVLALQSSSGNYAGNRTVYRLGITTLGQGGGGGATIPGGLNYDVQYNDNNTFGGATDYTGIFQYIYDATIANGTPSPILRHIGRIEQGVGVSATGLHAIALGFSNAPAFPAANVASGDYSMTQGEYAAAYGRGSHAEGFDTVAEGANSHAEGFITVAYAPQSHAEGRQTLASGSYSHAEGFRAIARGEAAHAEGFSTTAEGGYSHAEGVNTTTIGFYSHAEGETTRALGRASHAEGSSSLASERAAHAEGYLTIASAVYSHAEGIGTIASASGQHAEGTYNIPSSTAIWVLGDGSSTSSRHNLIEGHTGQVRFSGSLFVQPGQGYLPLASQSTVLTYNPSTGQIQLMSTSSFVSGGGGGGGSQPQYWIQDGSTLFTSGGFNDVQVTGSLYASGSTHTLVGRTTVSGGLFIQPTFVPTVTYTTTLQNPLILAYNTTTGQVQKTSLAAVGALPAPPSWSIQFNRNGAFGGTQFFLYSESLNTVFAATQLNIGLTNRVSTGTYGMVMGLGSVVAGTGSFAQGLQVSASGIYSHAQGSGSRAGGIYSHAEGRQTFASGRFSHAEGWLTTASADHSHTEGYLTRATQDHSHAEGFQTLASGLASHAEGRGVTASGAYSHAEGFNAQALDQYSHAEGGATIASGAYAHAEGQGAQALADGAHAEGFFTLASGVYSHAEGRQTTASGQQSHAQGRQTQAIGDWSFAGGFRTVASASYQSVLGRYNIPVQDEQTVFLVGGGFSGQDKNTLLLQTASMQLTGSLYIQDSTWPVSGEVYLPRASQSLMLVYNQSTGQVQLMHTASLIPTERDPIFTSRSASLATTGSNIFKDKQTISGAVYIPQPNMPFATQSSLVVYDPSTGQLQLMSTSSLPKDGYWIQSGSTLYTSGGFSDVQITGSLFLSSSEAILGRVVGGSPRSSTVPGPHRVIGGIAISSSYIDAPALYVYNANTQSRALHVEGGVGMFISAPVAVSWPAAHQINGYLNIGRGIGNTLGNLEIVSASSYQGMRTDTVTRVVGPSTTYAMVIGSDNTIHTAPGVDGVVTVRFPNTPNYGTTFTLIVDRPGDTTIQTGSITDPGLQPICRIQSPTSTAFAGAAYATSHSLVAAGVYNYMFLNVSSGSVGNAWVLTSKM